MMEFTIIAAMDEQNGIGIQNRLPWHLSEDLKHFAEVTKGQTVIMGRRTWESLPKRFRPLPERHNIVLSSQEDYPLPEGVDLASGLDEALERVDTEEVFVIGGATLFEEVIAHESCERLVITEVYQSFDCDTFFPTIPKNFHIKYASQAYEENGLEYRIFTYERV